MQQHTLKLLRGCAPCMYDPCRALDIKVTELSKEFGGSEDVLAQLLHSLAGARAAQLGHSRQDYEGSWTCTNMGTQTGLHCKGQAAVP